MNALHLKQMMMMMMFSSSSSSIVHTTGFLSANTRVHSDRFIRKISSTKNQTDIPVLHTYRDVPGTLSLRFLWRIFILELGLFLETVSRCFQDNAN